MKRLFTTTIILIIIAGLVASIWFVISILNPVKLEGEGSVFEIAEGEGVNIISYNLKEQGIIRSSFAFETYVYLKDVEHKFQAGAHELPQVLNTKRLVEILTMPEPAEEWSLTVIEGWTARDIGMRLENLGKFQSEELLEAIGHIPGDRIDFESKYDFLEDKPEAITLEGYLFPDTYRYFIDADIEDVANKMLKNFDRKLTPELRREIERQDKTIFDVVTMASIIEREVRSPEDMKIVSGIFWKRLDIGMALQADSTVNYITGKNTPAVSAEDLEIDSLYNTYMYPGLPPGPISNPGLPAIEAAIYPEESDYFYFLTDEKGNVHYGASFDEHIANKEEYL